VASVPLDFAGPFAYLFSGPTDCIGRLSDADCVCMPVANRSHTCMCVKTKGSDAARELLC
jgi:hypothetical protein